jgi:hypothetical protein
LLSFYPRQWRKRYGDEFLALLETTAITRSVVRDVVRTAAREWYERTYAVRVLLAPVVTTAALWTAVLLTRLIKTPPTSTVVNGESLVSPPWPVSLGFLMPVVMFTSLVPLFSAYISLNRIRMQFNTTFWVLLAYVAVTTSAWGDLVIWYGTGIPMRSWSYIWWRHAIVVWNCLALPHVAGITAANYAASLSWWRRPQS